jgi:hypothetical protein
MSAVSTLLELDRRFRPPAAVLVVILACILPLVLPNWFPNLIASSFHFFHFLSLSFILPALALLAAISVVAITARLLAGRAIPNLPARVIGSVVATYLSFGLALSVNRVISGGYPFGSQLLRFDREVWLDEGSSESADRITERQRMIRDVVEDVLPGKQGHEIEALLGPSLETAYFQSTGRDLIYYLGRERQSLFSIDSEWLLIWLDDRDEFERAELRTD